MPTIDTDVYSTQPASRKLGLAEADMMEAQVFQVASCNWRCWYCFVPYELLLYLVTQATANGLPPTSS
jgi:rRNA maturation endonuclease Nob1